MKRGLSAVSPSACRSRFIAALMMCSNSMTVSLGQKHFLHPSVENALPCFTGHDGYD